MDEKLDRFLKPVELAKALGVSRCTVYALVRKGVLPQGVRLGRSRRWRVADIQDALSRCELGAKA